MSSWHGRLGFWLIVSATGIFGYYGIFIKALNLPIEVILYFNALITTIALFVLFIVKSRQNFGMMGYTWTILMLGFTFIGNNFCYFKAFKLTTISNAILVHYLAPVFVALLVPLIGEKIEKRSVIALILSLSGLVIIVKGSFSEIRSAQHILGIMFSLISAVMYAFSILLYKYLLKDLTPFTLIFYQSLIATIILTPLAYKQFNLNFQSLCLLICFALLFGIIGPYLHFKGINYVKAQQAGILGYMEPIFGTIYAFLFLHQIPSFQTFIGGSLIILGGYLIFKQL